MGCGAAGEIEWKGFRASPKLFCEIGRDFLHGYMETAIGFAMLSMAKVLGPKRTLLRFGRNLKTTGNQTTVAVYTSAGQPENKDIGQRIVRILADDLK